MLSPALKGITKILVESTEQGTDITNRAEPLVKKSKNTASLVMFPDYYSILKDSHRRR